MAARKRGNLLGKEYGAKEISTSKTQDSTIQTHDKHKKKYEGYEEEQNEESISSNKEKRINMAFSDSTYTFLFQQSSVLGVTIAFYLNELIRNTKDDTIQQYYNSLLIKPNKAHISRRKGAALKRITVKFEPEIHHKMVVGSEKYNQTLTQYVNMIVDLNTK